MKATAAIVVLYALVLGPGPSPVTAQEPSASSAQDLSLALFPQNPTFTTLSITPLAIEGLTGDAAGKLYTTGRAPVPTPCPVWRIDSTATPPVVPVQIGSIPNSPTACNPSGITFDRSGNLYVADANLGGVIWRLTSANMNPTTPFVTGVPGTNGIAFDRAGNLWTGDGTTGQGRVWRIGPGGGVCEPSFTGCTEAFRIQPMANVLDPAVTGGVASVSRDARTLPPGTIDATRAASNTLGSQPLVANGVAFDLRGNLYVADTARGALWKVEFDKLGNVTSPRGCDPTFTADTLCLDNVFMSHPFLEGADGIALDLLGNIWVDANERDAVVIVSPLGRVAEFFRNPVNAAGLRNSADASVGNDHILEFRASPFLLGRRFCTSNSDGNRRDNSPNAAGEISSGGPIGARGKISCLDQPLLIPGMALPVR